MPMSRFIYYVSCMFVWAMRMTSIGCAAILSWHLIAPYNLCWLSMDQIRSVAAVVIGLGLGIALEYYRDKKQCK